MPSDQRKKIVVVGGGFGGLSVAKSLRNSHVDVTLIDKTNHHLFQPLLYQVATAALSPADIAQPLRAILSGSKNITVVMDEVVDVDVDSRNVIGKLDRYEYDHLVIATGTRHSYFGHDEWEQFAPGLKDLTDALEIRRRLLQTFEQATKAVGTENLRQLLTFVIVGGGPTGVELAGAVSEIALRTMLPDFPQILRSDVRIILIEGQDRVLTSYHKELSHRALRSLTSIGVDVLLLTKVVNINSTGVRVQQRDAKTGELNNIIINSSNIIWAAGNAVSPILSSLHCSIDSYGRPVVGSDCSIVDHPEICVIGDAANFDYGLMSPLPGVAQVAIQMGRYVAGNILRGTVEKPFAYKDLGSMATIGRAKAVVELGRLRISGFIAWIFWAVLHIIKLISFRNRLKVLVEWMWYYVSFQPGARLLIPNIERKKSTVLGLLLMTLVGVAMPGNSSMSQTFDYEVFDTDMPSKRVFKERRERLLDSLPGNSIAVVLSADERNRQNDVDYEYRQNSNLLYLTGYPHPNAVLLLSSSGIVINGRKFHEVMFIEERVAEKEQWTGTTAGPKETMQVYGLDTALASTKLTEFVNAVLKNDSTSSQAQPGQTLVARAEQGIDKLFVAGWPTKSVFMPLLGKNMYIDKESRKGLTSSFPALQIVSQIDALVAMREVKDTAELRLMRKAIDVTVAGHRYAMSRTKPGMKEFEIEALIEFGFKAGGAEDVGYPSIVGSGYNACILHYIANRRAAKSGDMILADCGAEYHGYTADVTRTFPLSGSFTEEQKTIYNIVLEAQDSGIAACRAGMQFKDPHRAAMRVVVRRLIEIGIISDAADAQRYFMHGTSHYLGLDVHDVGRGGLLQPNSVITVEPGIYIAAGSACDKRWWNIGVRIEDDILITDADPINLSGALPRKAAEIEALVGSAIK
ncbi:MAG: aminopeptidase P N-terminal domain-containing protein [Ignavibacteria bacterium]|nr:aminopeptidase P N-terminal domain-containing protein [Ignavibacteria bacterium]